MKKIIFILSFLYLLINANAQDAIGKTLHGLNDVAKIKNKSINQKVSLDSGFLKGDYMLVSSSGLTADGGVLFNIPGTTSFLLKRIIDESKPINIEIFGAIGDGVTLNNNAIKNALKYKSIIIPLGKKFLVSDSVVVDKVGTKISGGGTIKQLSDSANLNVFVVKADSVTFDNITIEGAIGAGTSSYAAGQAAIFDSGYNYLTINNCTFLKQNSAVVKNASFIKFTNNTVSFTGRGAHFYGADNDYIHDIICTGNFIQIADGIDTSASNIRGIRCTNAYNVTITNNHVLGAELSIELYNHNPKKATNNNVSFNITDRYISLVTGSAVCIGNTIDSSLTPTNAAPLNIGSQGIEIIATDMVTCIGNILKKVPAAAIYCGYPAGSQNNDSAQKWIVSGNVIDSCGTANTINPAISVGNGVIGVVQGNIITNAKSTGIFVAGSSDRYVAGVLVANNSINNCVGDAIRTYLSRGVSVLGNTITNVTGKGIRLGAGASPVYGTVVKYNNVNNCTDYAIYIDRGAKGYDVTDNILKGNSSATYSNRQIFIENSAPGRCFNNSELLPIGWYQPAPLFGTWASGETINTDYSTSGIYNGLICTVSGTQDTLYSVTGGISSGDSILTLSASHPEILTGQFISIAGVTGSFKIVSIDSTYKVIKLNGTAIATVSGAAVNYSHATFINKISPDYLVRAGVADSAVNFNTGFNSFSFMQTVGSGSSAPVYAPIPGARYWGLFNLKHRAGYGDGANYGVQIGVPITGTPPEAIYFRKQSNGTWDTWKSLNWSKDTLTINNSTGERHVQKDINSIINVNGTNAAWGSVEKYTTTGSGAGRYGFKKFVWNSADSIQFFADGTIEAAGNIIAHDIPIGNESDSLLVKDNDTIKVIAPLPTLASGAFTPTFTNTTNISSSTFRSATYTRNGNVITCRITGLLTPSNISTATVLDFTLPVNPGGTTQLQAGTITFGYNDGSDVGYISGQVDINSSSGTANFICGPTATSGNFTIIIQYIISVA